MYWGPCDHGRPPAECGGDTSLRHGRRHDDQGGRRNPDHVRGAEGHVAGVGDEPGGYDRPALDAGRPQWADGPMEYGRAHWGSALGDAAPRTPGLCANGPATPRTTVASGGGEHAAHPRDLHRTARGGRTQGVVGTRVGRLARRLHRGVSPRALYLSPAAAGELCRVLQRRLLARGAGVAVRSDPGRRADRRAGVDRHRSARPEHARRASGADARRIAGVDGARWRVAGDRVGGRPARPQSGPLHGPQS
jgi:hypothetical protein